MNRREFLAAGSAVAAASAIPSFAFADDKTIQVYSGSDNNIIDFWNNTIIPAFHKANPVVIKTANAHIPSLSLFGDLECGSHSGMRIETLEVRPEEIACVPIVFNEKASGEIAIAVQRRVGDPLVFLNSARP